MATPDTPTLDLTTRDQHGSRAMRRLRRAGRVPGIIYGGEGEPLPVEVDARILRNTLAHTGAVLQVTVDGQGAQPVQVKDVQRHGVRGEIVHADFYRVRMDVAIQAAITIDVVNAERSQGVIQGGILTQETNSVTVEALPGDLPEVITFDASGLAAAETVYLDALELPDGVRLLDDPQHVLVSVTMPSEEAPETDEIETEVAVVGEEAERKAEGDTADEAAQAAGDDS